eukprot:8485768-Heterocapsa_arctica.AAC.1
MLDFWRVQEQRVDPEIRHGADSDSPCWLNRELVAAEYEWPLQAGRRSEPEAATIASARTGMEIRHTHIILICARTDFPAHKSSHPGEA